MPLRVSQLLSCSDHLASSALPRIAWDVEQIHIFISVVVSLPTATFAFSLRSDSSSVRPKMLGTVSLANRPSIGRSPNSNPSVKIGVLSSAATSDDEGLKKSGGSKWNEWKRRLLQISNIASILCVVDCTVLPAVTIFLPILGLATSAERAKWLADVGHSIALWFVMPVGGLAATMNYLTHKKAKLSALAALGLTLIYAANGHGGPILSRLPHHLAHNLHCGTWLHRATNLFGCACLLGSNYYSHQIGGCAHNHIDGSCSSHDHQLHTCSRYWYLSFCFLN